jgi:hypothetical protein
MYMCVSGINFTYVFTMFRSDYGTVLTVWYFMIIVIQVLSLKKGAKWK